ncbi:hypothetical protein MAC_02096 [Metarhizium acridum CQMa 102]|uniref:Uncharacterized protein n=2 Tax=Metarhizium acridum TaxID=92637 RepID=E9DWU8_METAQ|nr:uncharacterized protein MAC_02096 [Metarhizium acridum CQMa 102]EFY91811.1 hypothetical protein MAC_02096 [Metarhizium acridum CQMa 102]
MAAKGPTVQEKHQMVQDYSSDAEEEVARQIAPRQPPQLQVQQPQIQAVAQVSEKSNPLKLRLDLNLDVDIQLRAKIHGDVTLALL